MSRERNQAGQFVKIITTERVLSVFDEVSGPVITTGDVADTLDCSREAARQKLQDLTETGTLSRRKTVGRFVYWRPDGGFHRRNPDGPSVINRSVNSAEMDDYECDECGHTYGIPEVLLLNGKERVVCGNCVGVTDRLT